MPYIPNTSDDVRAMLKTIGVACLEDLYKSIDPSIRLSGALSIPEGLTEYELKKKLESLAAKNKPLSRFNSFLGAGSYDHYVPAALDYLLSNSAFLTAYTPYQAECSQGVLQAIYEYQSYICDLTGMDVSNASLLDGASALAEAVLMALRIRGKNEICIAGIIHPEYRKTLKTYIAPHNVIVKDVTCAADGGVDIAALTRSVSEDTACCIVQSPNFFGIIEDLGGIAETVHLRGAIMIAAVNPLSLALLKEPAALGVDIVCGEGQPLGGALNFGGPGFGFLAAGSEYIRQIPGRVVGKTTDNIGRSAYCLTLQAREQHIRREKATSNICSNQSLNVIAAAIYLSLMGEKGLRLTAKTCLSNTQYLYHRLAKVRGIVLPFGGRVFNEFLWCVDNSRAVLQQLYAKGIIGGYCTGQTVSGYENAILSCCSEKKTKADIDSFVNSLAEVLHG